MDINLKTTILINQRVSRVMMENKSGRIINISSVDSEVVSKGAERAIYSTAKAAVNHWTRMLASEMQPYNVRDRGFSSNHLPRFFRATFWLVC